ncbi:hypothetical protein ACIQMR_35440 [Streptomyces sp. NPDC091376]|uniref:hypothetical protein n=1 Tax=Streptomyces sp. NPDC091376 TaxID=3365994 RepID=UPI0037F723E5
MRRLPACSVLIHSGLSAARHGYCVAVGGHHLTELCEITFERVHQGFESLSICD